MSSAKHPTAAHHRACLLLTILALPLNSCLDPAPEPPISWHDEESPTPGTPDAIIRTLRESRDAGEIAQAAGAASELKDPRVFDALLSTIREGRIVGQSVKRTLDACGAVAEALRKTADPRTSDALVSLLHGNGDPADPHVLELISRILPAIEDPRTFDLVAPLLAETIAPERKAVAAGILIRIGSGKGVSVVADALLKTEENELLRSYASVLAATRLSAAADALLARWDLATADSAKVIVLDALGECGDPRAIDVAIAALNTDKSADVRRRAAVVALRSGFALSWAPLHKAVVSDPDASVRAAVAGGLYWGPVVRANQREVFGALVQAVLQDTAPAVRVAAIGSLYYLRETAPAAYVAAMRQGLSDKEMRVRAAAAGALGVGREMIPAKGDGPEIIAALRAMLRDPEPNVREAAGRSLRTFETISVSGGSSQTSRRFVDSAGRLLPGTP